MQAKCQVIVWMEQELHDAIEAYIKPLGIPRSQFIRVCVMAKLEELGKSVKIKEPIGTTKTGPKPISKLKKESAPKGPLCPYCHLPSSELDVRINKLWVHGKCYENAQYILPS